MDEETPLDADELMNYFERVEQLPPDEAEWVNRLFQECLRARMHEAELLSGEQESAVDSQAEIAQVALDTAEWLKTLWNVGYMGAGSFPAQPRTSFPLVELEDVLKSALFARIRQGKRPLPFPPPTRNGLPWHDLLDDIEGTCHSIAAEIVRDAQGQLIGLIIEGASDWQIIKAVVEDKEYVIQHQGKGPLFRLHLDSPTSTLCREPPEWSRDIRRQERGGIRTFTLLWTDDNGKVQNVSLRAVTWERAESEAAHWVALHHPEMYGRIRFVRLEPN